MTDKIKCEECGALVHSIQIHLKKGECSSSMSFDEYKQKHPLAEVLSEAAKAAIAQKVAKQNNSQVTADNASAPTMNMAGTESVAGDQVVKSALHEVFALGTNPAALSAKGNPVLINKIVGTGSPEMLPEVNDDYVYDVDELKNAIIGLDNNIPTYVWGHKGAGKTEFWEQVCARTGRPMIRVQHTANMQESDVVGQTILKPGETAFEYGPLPLAMLKGWVYLADEYDFASPSVLALYQAVLEGKPLVIKEAPAAQRMVRPHPNFRIVATGNTNGSGDETGLYQGTQLQNAANYDRFGMVIKKKYMDKKSESKILQNHVGLVEKDADKLVEFATLVREAYDSRKISDIISPRTLIYAARIGFKRGSWRAGIQLSFINKLSTVDAEVVNGLAQRVFG